MYTSPILQLSIEEIIIPSELVHLLSFGRNTLSGRCLPRLAPNHLAEPFIPRVAGV